MHMAMEKVASNWDANPDLGTASTHIAYLIQPFPQDITG